ncbi:2'-5' RNA ligase family protein [Chitinophaga sp. Cy-1792]|uniref:2'-5' RNA ligase family protein n=1 Tax=Chitinophaga sp. Cy-1792 TaxID=2608339 RepID=UPI0014220B30|nr:2'-5' RNA ligase family protein [Chitinophaga sp. Cy-1792]
MIVTLQLSGGDQQYFNALRDAHYPKRFNYLQAHITLFYKLPEDHPEVMTILADAARVAPFTLEVTHIFSFGPGVAFSLQDEALTQWHTGLQARLAPYLIRQDQQPLHPHITIQNKVTTFKATQLQASLMASFQPFFVKTTGLQTWRYLKGPWKALSEYPFQG